MPYRKAKNEVQTKEDSALTVDHGALLTELAYTSKGDSGLAKI